MMQKKRAEQKNELEEHMKKFSFTADAMPTYEMVHEAYRKAIEQEMIRQHKFLRDAPAQIYRNSSRSCVPTVTACLASLSSMSMETPEG